MSIPPVNFGLPPPNMRPPPGLPPPGVPPPNFPLVIPPPGRHRIDVPTPSMQMPPPSGYSRNMYTPDPYRPPQSSYPAPPMYQNYPSSSVPNVSYTYPGPLGNRHNVYPPYSEFKQRPYYDSGNIAMRQEKESLPNSSSFDYFGKHIDSFYSSKNTLSSFSNTFVIPKAEQWETLKNMKTDIRSHSSSARVARSANHFERESRNESSRSGEQSRDRSQERDLSRESDRHRSRESNRYRSRERDGHRSRESERPRTKERDMQRSRDSDIPRSRERDGPRSRESERPRTKERDRQRSRDSDRPRSRERDGPRSRESERPRTKERDRHRSRDSDRPRSRERDGPRSRESERPRTRERDRQRSRDSDRPRSRERDGPRSRESERPRTRERDRSRSREHERARYRDAYEDRRHEREKSYYSKNRSSHSSSQSHDRYERSSSRRTPSRESLSRSCRSRERSSRREREPMTDREKIQAEFRKNYCRTSDDMIEKLQQWTKENNLEEGEGTKMWYRSSPADLYYRPLEGSTGVQQSKKLKSIIEIFNTELIERGRKARPEVDELPPLQTKTKLCSHTHDGNSPSPEESMDEGEAGLESDMIMQELERKQNHPRRLHPEMWFNNAGEMNSGPLCRCSARARRFGMRHGVYAGEQSFPKCVPTESNMSKLFHYRITVSPPTNFLIKSPTIIAHDEHEFLFSGFSMFSHYKLSKLPTCKVIRFNIEYTILYVEEPAPENFSVQELDLFQDYVFTELLELVDVDLGKPAEPNNCSQFHFMPRFVRFLSEGGCEILSMCEVTKYLVKESGLLIPPDKLKEFHRMDHYNWQKFVDQIKGMIVTYPGKKPCSLRVDQLDRSPPAEVTDVSEYYPEIVHFGIRPPQLSYAGNPEYQKRYRFYVKYRHLIANMAKPTYKDRQKLAAKEAKLQEMRTQSKMKRDVTVALSSEGFHTTGLMCDVVQHAMLIPVLTRHLRFHKSLDHLEMKIGYVFKQRALLQTALTHPSYRENFGTNPDHARNSLTNCGIRQPEYGDRRIHYTRKKGKVHSFDRITGVN